MRRSKAGEISLFETDLIVHDSPTIVARLYNEKRGAPRQLGRSNSILFQLVGQKNRIGIQEGIDLIVCALRAIPILDPIPPHMQGFSALSGRLNLDGGNIAVVIEDLPSKSKLSI
jgi:hypothetical protein